MAGSHTPTSMRDTSLDSSALTLISTLDRGLPERLAGRVDGHLATFAAHMREGLLAASTAVGLEVMAELMDAEVTELVGPKGRHNGDRTMNRHGTEAGGVTLGGRRVPVRRPRVRTVGDDASEVQLESYTTLAATDLLAEGIVARMLAGISTRRYPVALEPVGDHVEQAAHSTSKSAVSRRFVNATAERLAELHARRLDDHRWLIVYLDGFGFGDHTLVGALGVTLDGTKVPLGVVEGSTENAAVCTRLVADLAARGLTPPAGSCSSSMAARRSPRPSTTSTARWRSPPDAAVIRNATSSITCPTPNGRSCAASCARRGPRRRPSRPAPTCRRSRAAWRTSGPVQPHRCAKGSRRR